MAINVSLHLGFPLRKIEEFTKPDIIASKTALESGWVNDPRDRGGETNHGITKGKALEHKDALHHLFGWDCDMRSLTTEMAFYIYDKDYWQVLSLDEISIRSPIIADKLFDFGINAGVKTAAKHMQGQLNLLNRQQRDYQDITEDGDIGGQTLGALDAFYTKRSNVGFHRFIVALLGEQTHHYAAITRNREVNEAFYYGWLGRVEEHALNYANLLLGS